MFDGIPVNPALFMLPYSKPLLESQAGWGGIVSPAGIGSLSPGTSAAVNYGAGAANTIVGGGGSTSSIVLSAPQIAGATIGGFAASGATWATAAIPIVGPIIAGVTIGLMALMSRKGPKQKVATTQIVNDVEPYMVDNLNGYLNGPRTREAYLQALSNFEAGWQYIVENCGDPVMGEPGQRCINERREGARPQWDACAPNCPNWFELYRDPILANPPVSGGAAATVLPGSTAGEPVLSVWGGPSFNTSLQLGLSGLGVLLVAATVVMLADW